MFCRGGAGMLGHQECLIGWVPGMRVDYISIKYILFGKEVDGRKCQKLSFLGNILMGKNVKKIPF